MPKDTPSAAPLPHQLKILLASMVKLGVKFANAFDGSPERDEVEYERVRYIHALTAVADLLRANNAPLHYARRLHRLAVALADLNEGKTDQLLAPSPRRGGVGAVTAVWLGRANAALGMAALIAAGGETRHRNAAAKKAERATRLDKSKLLSWYDEFRKPADKSRTRNPLARAPVGRL